MLSRRAILEALFTSRTRVSLLSVFLAQPRRGFYSRELERITGERQNAVWRELRHLEGIGLLTAREEGRTKVYRVSPDFPLTRDLRALLGVPKPPAGEATAAADPSRTDAARERARLQPYRPELVIGETD